MGKNAAEIAAPIRAVYGAEAAETFERAWSDHVTYVFNYSRGVADDDAAVKSEARRQLDGYVTELSEYLAEATHQRYRLRSWPRNCACMWTSCWSRWMRIPRGTTSALSSSSGYAHMFPLGKALAAGIVIGEGRGAAGGFASPAAELQSQLGMRFGEHAELAVDAMRSGISNYPDFPVAAATLDQNTREITAMIESVFGGRARVRSRRSGPTTSMPSLPTPRHWHEGRSCPAGRAGPAHRVQLRVRELPVHLHGWATWNGRAGGRVRHA